MCDIGQRNKNSSGLISNLYEKEELQVEQWAKILDELKVNNVHIQGVEPLLYKNIDLLLCKIYKGRGISITTNGWFLQNHIEDISKYCSSISVSLDGASAELHDKIRGVPGSFNRALEGIKLLRNTNKKIKIRISFAINPDNYMNIKKFYNIFSIKMNLPIVFNHYNYLHPDMGLKYNCSPSNLEVYDLNSIDLKTLLFNIESCGANSCFQPNLKTIEELTQYYKDKPQKDIRRTCAVLNQIFKGERFVISSNGDFIISSRCWIGGDFGNILKGSSAKEYLERVKEKTKFMNGRLPPPCQRLCCAGKTV
jgi:MoaA/NifB/PqqE/SkfB family radical SAM enzyme